MSKFIKLTSLVINTSYISKIVINPNKYCIYMVKNEINGSHTLFNGSGAGWCSSKSHEEIEICDDDPLNYKIISEWINNVDYLGNKW
jgi:hypothetical protein